MKNNMKWTGPVESPAIISLPTFAAGIGASLVTLWRWRRAGIIKTVNIYGRQYITREAVEEFTRRAAAGEFAKDHKTPSTARSK